MMVQNIQYKDIHLMDDFQLWFITGFEHILDFKAYDHIAFLVALTVMFAVEEWKYLLIQITAFTIGHSLTLALSVLNILSIKQSLIEFLIPLTILLTSMHNLISLKFELPFRKSNYYFAIIFGLVHGLGFSFLLKAMLGTEESIAGPLFAFNTGIEAGQLLIVGFLLIIALILTRFLNISSKVWQFFASIVVLIISIYLLVERI